jgi:Predicted EndoIII-related endonuclease
MIQGRLTLGEAVKRLRKHYGPPERPPTTDPFELILLENVAYLTTPERRREAFEHLKSSMGTSPEAILTAEPGALERVTARGILEKDFAYSKTYAASRQAADTLRAEPSVMQEAHLLLFEHGRTLCKRTAPRCEPCPLARGCTYFQNQLRRAPQRTSRPVGRTQ